MRAPRPTNPIDEDLEARAGADPDDEDEGDEDDDEGVDGDDDGDEDEGDVGDAGELAGARIGDPFAMSSDVELIEAWAIVQHEDGRKFKLNLLTDRPKVSPHTQQKYTHALIVAPEDDDAILGDVIKQVMQANGTSPEEVMASSGGTTRRGSGGGIPEG